MSYSVADELVGRGIPFVFSTGYGEGDLPDGYKDLPVLKKPFRRSGLGDVLAGLLATSQLAAAHAGDEATAKSAAR